MTFDPLQQIVDRVYAEYDRIVRGNTTDQWDAEAAVATCDDGEVQWEVVECAEDMGVPTTPEIMEALFRHMRLYYQPELRNRIENR